MVVERTASFGKLHLKGIVASVGLTAGLLVLIFPLPELESPARIQLALTLGALSFWASGVMPAPITGMLYMGLLLITNSSDPLTVFSGWTNEGGGLWLVLCAFLIASGVERSGLARRAALSICASGQVKGFQSLIAAIAVIELLFALIIPSAFARTFVAYCAVFATPFHAPLLQRSMADCHVAMRVALIARGAQAPLLANTAGYALSRCACALTRRLQYG